VDAVRAVLNLDRNNGMTTPQVGTPVMVRHGLIYFEDSIYPLSTFRAAHLRRFDGGTYASVIDLGTDDHVTLYEGNNEEDARTAIVNFLAHVVRKPAKVSFVG
jgi:hypothetical protein